MTAGLTCARCKGQLYPHTAKRTDDGFTHIHHCPRMCSVEDCDKRHHSGGYCITHGHRFRKYGDPLMAPRLFNKDERLEDCRWMAETGESFSGAASRLGLKRNALENWLRRNDPDTLARLLAREPKDHNRSLDGVSVSELIGKTERLRRRREVAA